MKSRYYGKERGVSKKRFLTTPFLLNIFRFYQKFSEWILK